MKRILSAIMILCCLFVVYHVECCASDSSTEQKSTERRGAMEFTELYVQRFIEFSREYNYDFDLYIHNDSFYSIYAPLSEPVYIDVNCAAGSLEIDMSDFTVKSLTMTMQRVGSTDEEKFLSTCIALSALEYDQIEDSIMKVNYRVFGGAKDAAHAALDIISGEILDSFQSGAVAESMSTGDRVKVYSGNYDYYVQYVDYSSVDIDTQIEEIWLIAESRG